MGFTRGSIWTRRERVSLSRPPQHPDSTASSTPIQPQYPSISNRQERRILSLAMSLPVESSGNASSNLGKRKRTEDSPAWLTQASQSQNASTTQEGERGEAANARPARFTDPTIPLHDSDFVDEFSSDDDFGGGKYDAKAPITEVSNPPNSSAVVLTYPRLKSSLPPTSSLSAVARAAKGSRDLASTAHAANGATVAPQRRAAAARPARTLSTPSTSKTS